MSIGPFTISYRGNIGLTEVEERILEYVNRVGSLLVERVVDEVDDPIQENRVWVDGTLALYKDSAPMKIRNRFGGWMRRVRRAYQIEGERGRWYPLDEKVGTDRCCGYSPLVSYLIALFGSDESFGRSSKKLSKSLGFKISETAVQRNTEALGRRLENRPLKAIEARRQSEPCDLMVVEIDGTTSPQIKEEQGVTGRESLKQPTEYKECNVVVIEKQHRNGDEENPLRYLPHDRWTGAMYGPRILFDQYVHESGIRMGQLSANRVVFVADGAKHNWEIRLNNFPDAVEILDVYHALEHLGDFCALVADVSKGKQQFARWRRMMLEGDTLQLIHELKLERPNLSDSDAGQKHINYFYNNRNRMAYDQYRESGYPIGSGLVEGSCKYVVGKRFKGSGMRWKRADNRAVLRARLAEINEELIEAFIPIRRRTSLVDPESSNRQNGFASA